MLKLVKVIFMVCLVPLSLQLFADEKQELEMVKSRIQKNIPSIQISSINKSAMDGIYEVLSSGQILYVSEDGNFLITGKMFSIKNGIQDLSADAMVRIDMQKAPMRREKISQIKESDMIVFKAEEELHKITVFTDVDCGYCRKLHKEMANYNKLGITVRYLGYPRAGLGSSSHKKLQTVWCADDPLEAMDKAKIDRTFGTDTCEDPLASHYALVADFGLNGTPAIILKSGRYLPGYLKADELIAVIKKDEKMMANTVAKAN